MKSAPAALPGWIAGRRQRWAESAAKCTSGDSFWTRTARPFDNTEITATQLADNLYYLQGEGGQIGVLAEPDGVLMVDTQFAPLTDRIVAAIREISTEPIKFALNTHEGCVATVADGGW